MKISGVNISGGIRLDPPVTPTPSGASKFVVGATREDTNATDSGSAYIYNIDGTVEVKLTASDGAASDNFGQSVAISDTHVVVGVPQAGAVGIASGSAYIYNLDGTGEVKITASDAAQYDQYGVSVAIQGDKIIVGAYANDDSGSNSGSVYVYNTDGSGELKITASDGAGGDEFGKSVAMSDTKIVVGAQSAGGNVGAAYIYNLDGTSELKIQSSDGVNRSDRFGESVAISDTKVVVSAPYNDDPNNSGSVYVYNLDGTGEQKISASDGAASDNFGQSVAISDTHVVVGVPQADIVGSNSGSVYVYNTDGTGEVKITPSDAGDNQRFGNSVVIQGDKIIVGTPQDNSGAVYVYNLDGTGEQKISAPAGAVGDSFSFGWSVAAN